MVRMPALTESGTSPPPPRPQGRGRGVAPGAGRPWCKAYLVPGARRTWSLVQGVPGPWCRAYLVPGAQGVPGPWCRRTWCRAPLVQGSIGRSSSSSCAVDESWAWIEAALAACILRPLGGVCARSVLLEVGLAPENAEIPARSRGAADAPVLLRACPPSCDVRAASRRRRRRVDHGRAPARDPRRRRSGRPQAASLPLAAS